MASKKTKQKVKRRKVEFSFEAIDASEVVLMGDFNHWNPKKHPMKRNENGVWTKVVMLAPGDYEYKFQVDGNWRKDPQNEQICRNRFGTYNNIVNVVPKP